MFHQLIPYFRMQMKICNAFILIPYEWPRESSHPIIHRAPWKRTVYRLTVLTQWIYVVVMAVNLMITYENNDVSTKMASLLFLIIFTTTLAMRTVILQKENEALEMVCSFLRYEETNPEVKTKTPDVMGKTIVVLGFVTSFGLAGTMSAILLVNPCMPPHLGYILFHADNGCTVPGLLARIALLIFDFFMWVISIAPPCCYVFGIMFIGLRCMDHYISIITGQMIAADSRKSVRRETTMPQVLESQSAPQKDSRTSKLAQVTACRIWISKLRSLKAHHVRAFHKYRQVYLLNRMYDQVLQAVFIPAIFTAAITNIIISLYACIRLHRKIAMPGLAFFPLDVIDGFSIIFIANVAAGVIKQSDRFLGNAINNRKYRNTSLIKKVAKSLGKVKVRFGSTNFIDPLTPFVFIDFSLTNTVNLLLIT